MVKSCCIKESRSEPYGGCGISFHRCYQPRHLICFKQWTPSMVMDILSSAISLKCSCASTPGTRLNILKNCKITILQEVNEPILNLAVSKAATMMGAYDVTVVDQVMWDTDYCGKIFSYTSDAIFVSTATHMCIQRFADQSSVPVLCMKSRTHASIQSLATCMAIFEEFSTMEGLNVSYVGPPRPVLNSYLLLCPMLGANIKFKCCCDKCPVSPLLLKASEDLVEQTNTECKQCTCTSDVLKNAAVVIAGPTTEKTVKIPEFTFGVKDICSSTCSHWIFFHSCPRGGEVDDELFTHPQSRTFNAFENMQYIAAALMAYSIRGYRFG